MPLASSTLYDWKKRYSEISEPLKRGKGVRLTEKEWEFAIKYFNDLCAYCGEYAASICLIQQRIM